MSDKIKNAVVTVSFLFVIIVIFISNILKDEIDISQAERRKLAKFPKVTISSILISFLKLIVMIYINIMII